MTRGVGYSWTDMKPTPGKKLFGGGGYQDGAVATITDKHAENVQTEEARTLDGGGTSGNIDQATNPQTEDTASGNKEFNFSQYKRDNGDMTQIGLSATVDGLSAGDILIVNDPRNDKFNQTSAALEASISKLYSDPKDRSKDVSMDTSYKTINGGINPFSQKAYARSTIPPHSKKPNNNNRVTRNDGPEYYFGSNITSTDNDNNVRHNRDTGLLRTKTMKSQSMLKANLHVKDEIEDANNEAYEVYKSERRGLKATFSEKEHDDALTKIRNPLSSFTAVQMGVASTANKYAKRHKRSTTSKLNQTIL